MSIKRFKVGDKVVVRHDLEATADYDNVYCNTEMAAMGGKCLTIKAIDPYCYDTGAYEVRECCWVFNDEMLETYGLQLDLKICCSRESCNFETEYKPTDIDSVISLYGGK